ncbi:hypothetical protein BP6252_10013 [Coleophoma cylindrospora]|uniref:Integral membrane protein n=1 Tax=Coleophoma cylindrospora TaxID=1849047 RepID=A0A3D8QXH1_9HELO|nr:hypothetical protein BP6252_10013 [Coleophoma cylindrospora]
MLFWTCRVLPIILLLLSLGLASEAFTHNHNDDGPMDMRKGEMGRSENSHLTISTALNSTDSGPNSYFRHSEYSRLVWAHIVLMSVGWTFVLPLGISLLKFNTWKCINMNVAIMLSIAKSRLSLPIQLAFLVINGLGALLATIYNTKTPDLYPNNAHHRLGWFLIWTICAHSSMAMIAVYTKRNKISSEMEERAVLIPTSAEVLVDHQPIHNFHDGQIHRFSDNSGLDAERNTESMRSYSLSSTNSVRNRPDPSYPTESNHDHQTLAISKMFLTQKLALLKTSRTQRIFSAVYGTINRLILLFGFVALATGFVTYAGIYRGSHVFSGLAHFIKGGVFFWYGILTLGRWAGCFADLGWAWNIKPSKTLVGHWKVSSPSAEFVESFLIFFYGCTNVFLEHLTAWGRRWSAQDLEHISISIMFFGGGLCGMLVESRKIRGLLNATTTHTRPAHLHNPYSADEKALWQPPKTYRFSMNLLPALIVLLLGVMMSSHHQTSMVSTMLHKQWGTLLVGAALARAVTYMLFYISPPTSLLPSRPPSELITAFCLMAGGLIFMASSVDTVKAIETNDLGAMFVFTMTMGLVTFLMAWIILVIAIKGWAIRRKGNTAFSFLTAAQNENSL